MIMALILLRLFYVMYLMMQEGKIGGFLQKITSRRIGMTVVRFYHGEQIPLEMHKTRIVQKLQLKPVEQRLAAMTAAGNNTFLLKNRDVFLDMLTDSGVNAMSDRQLATMMVADDSYAGSEGFLTYGGMSTREMEALAVGLEETMDEDMISQSLQFIAYMVEELQRHKIYSAL